MNTFDLEFNGMIRLTFRGQSLISLFWFSSSSFIYIMFWTLWFEWLFLLAQQFVISLSSACLLLNLLQAQHRNKVQVCNRSAAPVGYWYRWDWMEGLVIWRRYFWLPSDVLRLRCITSVIYGAFWLTDLLVAKSNLLTAANCNICLVSHAVNSLSGHFRMLGPAGLTTISNFPRANVLEIL